MNDVNDKKVLIVGAGLAGSDAAWSLAEKGVQVVLLESKRLAPNPAQKLKTSGELVCTNSLKSTDPNTGHGLLKREMDYFGSLVLEMGRKNSVPAGSALAVDREKFSADIHEALKNHPNITLIDEVVENPLAAKEKYGAHYVVLATGPLTNPGLESWLKSELSSDDLYFYDAIAPVVEADSLDLSQMYFKDRHTPVREDEVDGADYLNIPLNEDQYQEFVKDLIEADKVPPQNFEELKFFESCLPIDTMAERGPDTLRFSCMRPVGLEMANGKRPFAVIQLRKENLLGSSFNLVGFQNRLTYKEQLKIFRKLPGFENATFPKLGSIHRNTFINSRKVLGFDLQSKNFSGLYFAGQITGVEGYTESAAMGLYVAYQILRDLKGEKALEFPKETALGALINYLMTCERQSPTNINFGLLPTIPLNKAQRKDPRGKKKVKKELMSNKAREAFNELFSIRTDSEMSESSSFQ